MINALRYLGLYPSEELLTRIEAYDPPVQVPLRRDDLAKRITLFVVVLLIVLSCVTMGLACNQMVHPMVGVGLFFSALCLSTVPCYLHHHQRSLLPQGESLEDLYNPPPPATPASSTPTTRAASPSTAVLPSAHPPDSLHSSS